MSFYTVYRTTNKINGMFYIGVHKTTEPNDSYLGSGKRLKYALKKYGVEAFEKEILHVFESREEAFAKEKALVTEEVLDSGKCYNVKLGGEGGFDHIKKDHFIHSSAHLAKMNSARKQKFPNGTMKDRKWSDSSRTRFSKNRKEDYSTGKRVSHTSGYRHSNDAKAKIGLANKIHQSGSKNSQYGTIWITDGVFNKKIKKDQEIPEGWKRGYNPK